MQNRLKRPWRPCRRPAALVPALASMTPKQGGAAVVTFKDDLTTLDPAVGYDWQNWSVIKSIFDGLMDYKPGTTELEPDLAESYTISDDGLTYTFKLRRRREIPQRPRRDLGRCQILDRARRQPGDPEPGRRLFQHDQGL